MYECTHGDKEEIVTMIIKLTKKKKDFFLLLFFSNLIGLSPITSFTYPVINHKRCDSSNLQ
jgi:hypothetical protein